MSVNALSRRYTNVVTCIQTHVHLTNPFNKQKTTSLGIWDTGATNSVVTKTVAQDLGLLPVQKAYVRGVHGVKEVNVYCVEITLNNRNVSVRVNVTECEELSPDNSVGMLIGMDIIKLGDFSISNYQGKTAMSFRVPSIETIDYVDELNEYNKFLKIHKEWTKQGNEKCPCGSGKLYKNCHGKSKYAT